MTNTQAVNIDQLRSLAFGSIAATYNRVGTAFGHGVRLICITNNTNANMFFSIDGVNDYLFLPANSFKLFDLNTNKRLVDQLWVFPAGTQFFVRYSSAPSSGSVYIECLYG